VDKENAANGFSLLVQYIYGNTHERIRDALLHANIQHKSYQFLFFG
jgi:hypothetical protein